MVQAKLGQPADLRLREIVKRDLGQRGTAPQSQRFGEQLAGMIGIALPSA